jgi:hypothetical protein
MLAHEIGILWAPTNPPSLNFCSALSKAKPEAMQEMQGNTSVDTCLDLLNKSLWSYLVVPTYLMELWWKKFAFSWVVERWNLSFVFLLLSLILKSIGENIIAIQLLFLNIRQSGTHFGMWLLTSAQQLFLIILPFVGWICGWSKKS